MQLQQYRDESGFAALRPEWNQLVQSSSANTVFSTWEWQTTWWEHLGCGDLWLTAVRTDDGRLIALFPCYRRDAGPGERNIRLVGCIEVADYLDLIIEKGHEEQALQAFLVALSSEDAPEWDTVDLCNLAENSPSSRLLPAMAGSAGLSARRLDEDVCPIIKLPTNWEAYLLSIDKKQRHEIRRKLRRAATAADMAWYIVDDDHDLHDEMEVFLTLHEKSRPDKGEFMSSEMRAFFHAIGASMQSAGWLQLMQLTLDGRHEASLMSFDYGSSIMLYNSGFDPDGQSHLSPGNVLISICIRHAIELGREVFDFLQGDEDYKYRFGARDTQVCRVLIGRED